MIFYTVDFLNLCCFVFICSLLALYMWVFIYVWTFIVLLYNAIEYVYRNRRLIK